MLSRVATYLGIVGVAAALSSSVACDKAPEAERSASSASADSVVGVFSEREKKLIERLSPLGEPPVDETNAVVGDERAATLGQFLFFDTRLSQNNKISCASCHEPDHGFSVAATLGHGIAGTPRHPPSLLNAAYHHWYNWDGSTDSLWAQAVGPLESPVEMGFTRTGLAHLIYADAELRRAYEAIFGELPDMSDAERFPKEARPVPAEPEHAHDRAWQAMAPEDRQAVNRVLTNVTKAMAAYQTKLVRKDAPFDTFVEGLSEGDEAKMAALSESQKRGLDLFLGKGNCVQCHTGPNFTDGTFHNLGLGPRDWLDKDEGRWDGVTKVSKSEFNATGAYSDKIDGKRGQWIEFLTRTSEDHGQFKTPTLRNVELTAPYMHGGHFETLEEVVRFYSLLDERVQLGHREEMLVPLGLSDQEIDDVVAFLKSLTGEPLPDELTKQPASPVSGAQLANP
ncbi:c-type cytochrome [Persicimonas caeni]|uniref:C-type cytochrome n=1 Tax=Persicimonas caeni TaxID=2292766 RepID=A0A4Y6PPV9_PERCE|nr:cytochrome c peroxidase [Persicimonas caeni]QDG50372.1 c-type cytochrome [Persicimonas caeni]QED31593.1 c-type cytochrome [Persicimonas caeni]